MEIRTILIDDNPMESAVLEQYCSNYDDLCLKGTFSSGQEALAYLDQNPVDLMFLDIEMPEMTGLELIERLGNFPQIIITTSNRDYAYNLSLIHI